MLKMLREKGIEFERVNYFVEPFTKSKLKSLLLKLNINPNELLRKNEKIYKDFNLKDNKLTENEIIELLVKNPNLIQRPIIEFGKRAVVARPIEKIYEILQ